MVQRIQLDYSADIKNLIDKYNQIRIRKKIYRTITTIDEALLDAVESNDTADVRLAIQCGANINYAKADKETPFRRAAKNGNLEIIKILIQNKADINAEKNYGNALILAARKGYVLIVEELLKAGADPDHANSRGLNSLYFAVQNNHLETVFLLLAHDAQVNFLTKEGWGSLDCAVYCSRYDIIPLLMERGAIMHSEWLQGFIDRDELIRVAMQKGAEALKIRKEYEASKEFLLQRCLNIVSEQMQLEVHHPAIEQSLRQLIKMIKILYNENSDRLFILSNYLHAFKIAPDNEKMMILDAARTDVIFQTNKKKKFSFLSQMSPSLQVLDCLNAVFSAYDDKRISMNEAKKFS